MRTIAIALSILLGAGGLQASLAQEGAAGTVPVTMLSPKVTQLAGAFQKSPNKLADKSLIGATGGFYGIGGSEPRAKYFKSRMIKIPRCCANSR